MHRTLAGVAAALALLSAPSAWALPKILICAADPSANVAGQIATGINPNGMYFAAIDTMDCSTKTPTVAQLKMYEAVFLWDDSQYADKTGLGNNLADYVDAGGGVVQGMFNFFTSFGQNWDLQGRWATGAYNCITPGNQNTGALKAAANDPNSPLVQGVTMFTSQNVGVGGLAKNATSVWDYSNGSPAIATCTPNGHLRVDTNFYPNPTNWKGDGYIIIRNALIAVAGGLSPLRAMPSPVALPDTGTGATSAAVTVTFTNTSMSAQVATGLAITGANASEFGVVTQPGWPVTLQPNDTFSVSVNFSPASMGARTAKLSIALQAQMGMPVPSADVTLNGKGIGAKLTVTPNPLNIGGTQIGTPISGKITVANNGGGRITISSIAVSDPAFAITQAPDLPVIIAGGGSFDVVISFSPKANGITTDAVTITTNDPNTPTIAVPISGYAGPPAIGTDSATLAFGNINVGASSAEQAVAVQNNGYSDLTITGAITLSGMNTGDYVLDTKGVGAGSIIHAQQAVPISVRFVPTTTGTRTAQVVIPSNDAMTPVKTVNLIGAGTTAALMVTPMMLSLGTVRVGQTGTAQDVTISSMGNGTLRVLSVDLGGANPGSFTQTKGPKAPFTIAPGANAVLSFACKPNTVGALTASANVVTDVGSALVMLSGAGISPLVSVTPNMIDFGVIAVNGTSPKQMVTIQNLGNDDLSLTDLLISGPDNFDFTSTDMPQVLPVAIKPGKSISFTVAFSPTNPTQELAQIDFATDDPLLPMGHIAMVGTGANAGLSAVPSSIDFMVVQTGQTSSPQPITLTNSGMLPLTLNASTISGPGAGVFHLDRAIDKNNTIPLAPKDSVVVNATFAPLSDGTVNGVLQVGAAGLSSPVQVSMRGTGYLPSIKIGVPGGAPYLDFGDQAVNTTGAQLEIQLLNASKGTVTLGAITADNPAFQVDLTRTQTTLSSQAKTSVFLAFAPTTVGTIKGTLSVKLKDGTSAVAVLGLQGNGTPADTTPPSGGCAVAGAE